MLTLEEVEQIERGYLSHGPQALCADWRELQARITRWSAESNSLAEQLAEARHEIGKLTAERDDLKEWKTVLCERIEELTAERNAALKQVEIFKKERE